MSTIYAVKPLGLNLSGFNDAEEVQHGVMRVLERGADEPTIRPTGLLWQCTDTVRLANLSVPAAITEAILRYNGVAWVFLCAVDGSGGGLINAGGQVPFLADQQMGGHKLTGLAAGTAAGHSVRFEQAMLLSGANAMTGDLDCGNHKVKNLADPTLDTDAVPRSFVGMYSAQHYYQTNRDALANGKPVKYNDTQNAGSYETDVGFVPRRLDLLLFGSCRRQSNGNTEGPQALNTVVTFQRWNSDSTGGYGGTGGTPTIDVPDPGLVYQAMRVACQWNYTPPYGFTLFLTNAVTGSALYLRNPSNAAIDGSLQIMALYGRGT